MDLDASKNFYDREKTNAWEMPMKKAKRVKHGGKDFLPGHPGGPGRPAMSPEHKAAKRLTKTAFDEIVNRHLWCGYEHLVKAMTDPAVPNIDKAVISILLKQIEFGDQGRLEFFLTRLLGRPKEQIEVTSKPFILQKRDGSEVIMGVNQAEEDE